MNIRFEIVNEIRVDNEIAKKSLDEAKERLKEEMRKKLETVQNIFHNNETVIVTIDYERSKASISVENVHPDRIAIIKNAINSIA